MKNLLYLKALFSKNIIEVKDCVFFERGNDPKTYFRETQDDLTFGYKSKNRLEYLNVKVDFIQKKVIVERDYKSSLIIYCFFDGYTLLLSDSFLDMKEFCTNENFDKDLFESSLFAEDTSSKTIFKNVTILFPERKYVFSILSADCELVSFSPTIDDFTLDMLPDYYEAEYGKQNIAYEVSGGKDSSLLPIITKLKHEFNASDFMYGLKFTGVDGETQMARIHNLSRILGVPYDYMDLDSDVYILNQYDSIDTFREFNFDPYKSALTKLKQILVKHNSTISFNGLGGDESFLRKFSIGDDTGNENNQIFDKIFQSRVKRSVYSSENSTIFSPSVYSAIMVCSNSFIRDGIWRVSPFQDVNTLNYLQNLKTTKKDFFKSFYNIFEEENFAEIFQNNESFQDFFRRSVNNSKFKEEMLKMCKSPRFNKYFDMKIVEKVLEDEISPEAERSKFRLVNAYHFYKMIELFVE